MTMMTDARRPGGSMRVSGEHLINQARERFALQDYYGAIHLLEEVVKSRGSFADAHHLLGLCFALLGQPERALEHFEAALAKNPRYIEAHIHRGILLTDLGRQEEAAEAFRHAASHNTESPSGFPSHVAANLANHHAMLAEAYAEAGALELAIDQYRRATEFGPTYADLRYRLARLLLESGNTLEARDELERVVADRPNFVDALAALGLARYLSGDAAGARAVWHDCLAERPKNARVEAYLAMMERAAQ
ncbi:MAG: tetratricopeptide repeat protein [Gemmatimonadales bacterium]